MICALYTLMEKYKNKKIYIWNISRPSVDVLMKAVFWRIDVQGFVVLQEEYENETFMNRPIITLGKIDEESMVLVSDGVPRDVVSVVPREKIIYWSEALEINKELLRNRVIVYGIGYGANQLRKVLVKEGIDVELYCVTQRKDTLQYKGKKVIEAIELEAYEDYAVIISVIEEQYRREILKTLFKFRGRIFCNMEEILKNPGSNLLQSIDLAIKDHRKIYLYSEKNLIAELVEDVLYSYDIKVKGYVHDVEDKEQNIRSIYDLALEGTGDKLIIINEELPEKIISARENIEFAGFSLEQATYTGIWEYTLAKKMMRQEFLEYHDPLVGGSILYMHGKPGWKIYGKETDDSIRILVLGGSTSSEVFHPENWVSKLFFKLRRQGIKIVIYNGAHPGNDIVDEILRLLRDGYALRPQIVLSMSGVNNMHYKECDSQFNEERLVCWVKTLSPHAKYCSGVYSEESLFSFWNRNIRILKLISEFYGAKFLGFLQPINSTISHMNLREKGLYDDDEHIIGARDFMRYANSGEGYINLMQLFEHQDEMYIDICHYTDKGHEKIANEVYGAIMPIIQTLH